MYGEHRGGILGAETDDVDHGGIEAVAADLMRVIGVADADKAFLQPVREPLGIKCRNICSLSGVDDHIALPADSRGLALLLVCCFCNNSVMGADLFLDFHFIPYIFLWRYKVCHNVG